MKKLLKVLVVLSVVASLFLTGCAGTMNAIEHSSLDVKVKMSDTIFLNENNKGATVFVRITNTSDMQEIQLEPILKSKLQQKGFNITDTPSSADYIIRANVLYMDYAKDSSMTADGMVAGGVGGALLGSGVGSGLKGNAIGSVVGGIVGSVIGGFAGKIVHVDRYIGVVDVRLQEKLNGDITITETVKSSIKQGSSTTIVTEQNAKSNYQTYATRIAVEAIRTNIDKDEAVMAITEKIATQITAIF